MCKLKNLFFGIFLFLQACTISSENPFYLANDKMDKNFDYAGTWEAFDAETKEDGNRSEYIEIMAYNDYYETKISGLSATDKELDIKFYPFYLEKQWLADLAIKNMTSEEDAKHLIVKLEKVNDKLINVYELEFKNDPAQELAKLEYEKNGFNKLNYHILSPREEVNVWLKSKIKNGFKLKKILYLERR